ncbi:MAG TPA: hypothetical protein VD790_10740 [Thermoleophilaceae bacterium]|nr:hypothetical protein [Thermoleophilaceae bacterium]
MAASSAGGAQLDQLIALGVVYFGGTGAVIWLVHAHRAGRTQLLARAGAVAGWALRVPGWAALPVAVASAGLLAAMWGGLWDIGYHVDNGRDTGPLGNPGHWPLLLGIFTTFCAGILALGMADQRDATQAWVPITRDWRVPIGGVLLVVCMTFGLSALALDDVWHRIFGQDVTLWSPTHFVFLFGGMLTVTGMLVLLKEGSIARAAQRTAREDYWRPSWGEIAWRRVLRVSLLGGLLCGLELYLAEFDWGVPLYRQVWQPLLLAAFAGFIFTAARAWAGPGSALGAWGVYALIRATGILVPVLAGVSAPSMPLLLAPAICVELLALGLDPRRRMLAFGAGAGLLCGTVGFAAEYGWSQFAMPLPWTAALLPEGLVYAIVAGVAGGLLGALFAAALRGDLPRPRVARLACVGAFVLLLGVCVGAAGREVPDARAQIDLIDVRGGPDREALATVRLDPPDIADGANWLYILAWAGGDDRVVDRLDRVGPGVYRSTEPIPLGGRWKVGLRLNNGRVRGAVPMRLPVDRGLPNAEQTLPAFTSKEQLERAMRESSGAELPAPASFNRPFGDDGLIVLRETKDGVSDWLWALGIGLTGLIWGLCIVGLALGLGRMARRSRFPAVPVPA